MYTILLKWNNRFLKIKFCNGIRNILGGLAAMTENEKKLIQQIYEKVVSIEKKVDKLDGRLDSLDNKLDRLDGKMDSLEGKVDSLEDSFKGLHATFENGFRDIHKELSEIKQINKNRKTAKEIVEGIAGNGQKQKGQLN